MQVQEKDLIQLHAIVLKQDDSPFKTNMLAWIEQSFKRRFKKVLGAKA